MDKETIEKIEAILKKGDRVELIPTAKGVRIIHIRREPIAFLENKREDQA